MIYKVPVKVLNILTDKGSRRCKSLVKSSIEPVTSRTPNLLFILCDKCFEASSLVPQDFMPHIHHYWNINNCRKNNKNNPTLVFC